MAGLLLLVDPLQEEAPDRESREWSLKSLLDMSRLRFLHPEVCSDVPILLDRIRSIARIERRGDDALCPRIFCTSTQAPSLGFLVVFPPGLVSISPLLLLTLATPDLDMNMATVARHTVSQSTKEAWPAPCAYAH